MIALPQDLKRRLLPRWRNSAAAAHLGELRSTKPSVSLEPIPDIDYAHKLIEWKDEPSIWTATDLIASAIVLGRESDVAEAAEFIMEHPPLDAPLVIKSANDVSQSSVPLPNRFLNVPGVDPDENLTRKWVHALRLRLNDDPRNAIAWVDLAREYTSIGQLEKAALAMRRAVILAPNNRFVLRSAARLYVHDDDLDRARALLGRRRVTLQDPWLLAAEVSVAAVAGRTSRHVRLAKEMIESGDFSPRDLSELAGAIATLELSAGETKKSRKLYRKSLTSPTENAVAQACWASQSLSGLEITPQALDTPRSFEANLWEKFNSEQWSDAVINAEQWLIDEPFSSRPAVWGSYLASVTLQDYYRSIRIAQFGLLAEPTNAILRNNVAVGLAKSGRVNEAEAELDKIKLHESDLGTKVTMTASRGLIEFRKGQPESGRALYRKAISKCNESGFSRMRVNALLHLALEETRLGTPLAPQTASEALDAFGKSPSPDLVPMVDTLSTGGLLALTDLCEP